MGVMLRLEYKGQEEESDKGVVHAFNLVLCASVETVFFSWAGKILNLYSCEQKSAHLQYHWNCCLLALFNPVFVLQMVFANQVVHMGYR